MLDPYFVVRMMFHGDAMKLLLTPVAYATAPRGMPTFPAVMPGGPAAAMFFEHLADADAAALKRLLFAMCVKYVVDFQ